jgi:hypothetical protein
LRHLQEVVNLLMQPDRFQPAANPRGNRGQTTAKGALEVAAAGSLIVHMIDPRPNGWLHSAAANIHRVA